MMLEWHLRLQPINHIHSLSLGVGCKLPLFEVYDVIRSFGGARPVLRWILIIRYKCSGALLLTDQVHLGKESGANQQQIRNPAFKEQASSNRIESNRLKAGADLETQGRGRDGNSRKAIEVERD